MKKIRILNIFLVSDVLELKTGWRVTVSRCIIRWPSEISKHLDRKNALSACGEKFWFEMGHFKWPIFKILLFGTSWIVQYAHYNFYHPRVCYSIKSSEPTLNSLFSCAGLMQTADLIQNRSQIRPSSHYLISNLTLFHKNPSHTHPHSIPTRTLPESFPTDRPSPALVWPELETPRHGNTVSWKIEVRNTSSKLGNRPR